VGIPIVLFLGGGGFLLGLVVGFVCGRVAPKDSNLVNVTLPPKKSDSEQKNPDQNGKEAGNSDKKWKTAS
jgi:hypothetical protein